MTDAKLLQDYLDAACEAAQRGATVLKEWRQRFQVHEKARADFVTEADLASQQTIRHCLLDRFPNHDFLGEEDLLMPGAQGVSNGKSSPRVGPNAPPTWIVDPLDGTTNYVHDCPMYCVSIALQIAGKMVVGVVLDPCQGELFTAAEGLGAWISQPSGGRQLPYSLSDQPAKRRLRTSQTSRLDEALLVTGFPPDLHGHEHTLDWWRYFSLRSQSMRRTGSTALNLAYVAAGRFDAYYAFDNHPWDVAAGVVLVREAGGMITNVDGSEYDLYRRDAVASNGPLHPAMLAALREGPMER